MFVTDKMLGSSFSQRFQASGILNFHVLIISKTETGMEKATFVKILKLVKSHDFLKVPTVFPHIVSAETILF